PQIKLVALRNLPTALGCRAIQPLNLADIDAQQAIAALNALVNLILHPSTGARLCANQHDSHRCAHKLVVYPSFDGSVTLSLDFLTVGSIHESSRFPTLCHPAITHNHRPRHVKIFKAEEDSSCHFSSPTSLSNNSLLHEHC